MIGDRVYYEGGPLGDSQYVIASIQRDGVTLRKFEEGEIPTGAMHDPQLTELPRWSAPDETSPGFWELAVPILQNLNSPGRMATRLYPSAQAR